MPDLPNEEPGMAPKQTAQSTQDKCYEEDREHAFQDSKASHHNLDRWLLALSSGGVALSAGLETASKPGSAWTNILALIFFVAAVIVSISSKYMHYLQCEKKRGDIESVYEVYPENFAQRLFDNHNLEWNSFRNRHTEMLKASIAFFLIGLLLLCFSIIKGKAHAP